MKVEALDHIHIYSRDPAASVSYYQTHFDAELLYQNQNIHSQTRSFLALGGQILVIGPFPPDITPCEPPKPGDGAYTHGFGVAHFGLRVRDLDVAIRELRSAGVEFLGEPAEESTGLRYAYLCAPDGVVIELTQYGSLT